MFIKYGEAKYLENFYRLGEMYFSPCVKFRELEESQVKGIGDKDDGGIRTRNSQCYIAPQNGKAFFVYNAEISFYNGLLSIYTNLLLKTYKYTVYKRARIHNTFKSISQTYSRFNN